MNLTFGHRLSRLWDHIKLSLNDPQWGRKSGDKPAAGDNDAAPDARPSPPPPAPSNDGPRNSNVGGGGGGGGGRKPDGPPDLDEILKKVSDKINSAFGGKPNKRPPSSGGPQIPSISPKFAAGGMILFGFIAVALWLASGFYQITEGQRGIVQRFGKFSAETTAGLNWHLPWPIETVTKVNLNQVRAVDIGFRGNQRNRDAKQAQMLTEDLNIIDITFSVQYFLTDAKAYVFNHRNPDDAVVQAAETAMREIVGKRKMDFLLNQGREEFAAATQKVMQELLARYGTGIQISKLNLQTVAAPEAVNEAFQDVVKAQQDRDRFINEGQAYANRVVPEARGRASRLLEEAQGYEQSVVARAQGDASRFTSVVAEYNKAPGVTRERLYIDMMQSVLGNTSKVLVDQRSGSNSLLYLPLDKLISGTRDAAGSYTPMEPPRPGTSETAPTPTPDASATRAATGRDAARTGRETR
ncbi:MAG: FtsH protease activity modulator HflK [Burkholderiales bacterium]|nr:MAG: FtsH protease activity modulator HflK [Betaproteobacteria bacterium]TAG82309.1 MAG: FtsH protease activity modulator HflK [Burkholderiales bacterium]